MRSLTKAHGSRAFGVGGGGLLQTGSVRIVPNTLPCLEVGPLLLVLLCQHHPFVKDEAGIETDVIVAIGVNRWATVVNGPLEEFHVSLG